LAGEIHFNPTEAHMHTLTNVLSTAKAVFTPDVTFIIQEIIGAIAFFLMMGVILVFGLAL
jgi:phage terminase Nu1 subunit (DNA packaging protein)